MTTPQVQTRTTSYVPMPGGDVIRDPRILEMVAKIKCAVGSDGWMETAVEERNGKLYMVRVNVTFKPGGI